MVVAPLLKADQEVVTDGVVALEEFKLENFHDI